MQILMTLLSIMTEFIYFDQKIVYKKSQQYQLYNKKMKICTHDGRFHCDQVLACTFLRKFTKQFKDATVVRSRDPAVWQASDVVVDVGGKYLPPKLLDHHQIQFQQAYPNHNVRMSSAGLVYLHFKEIIPNAIALVLEREKGKLPFQPILNEAIVEEIREKIYKNLIIFVDANDNGVDKVYEKDVAAVPTTLWSRIAKINPMWWDEGADQNALFHKAMDIVEEEFYEQVKHSFLGSIQTVQIVRQAFNKRFEVNQTGSIILFNKYIPWQKPLVQIEQENKCVGTILYVIYPQKSGKKWRIQAVAKKQGSFELRKPLKSQWRGIKDQEKLKNLSGIEDIDFVHANGFIGGAVSVQGTIKMALKSIDEA